MMFVLFVLLCIVCAAIANHRELRRAAKAAAGSGDWPRALQLYEQALSAKDDDFNSHYGRATALIELQRFDDALAALDRTLALKSKYWGARVTRAELLLRLERESDAEQELQIVLQGKPTHAAAKRLAAGIGEKREARLAADALEAAADAPCSAQLVKQLSSAIFGLRDSATRGASVPLRLRRARCLREQADWSGVLEDTRRVIADAPSNSEAYELRGHGLFALGETEAAAQHFHKCVRDDPDNAPCRWHWKRARAAHRALAAAKTAAASRQYRELLAATDDAAHALRLAFDEPLSTKQPLDALRGALAARGSDGGVHHAQLMLWRCEALAYHDGAEQLAVDFCQLAAAENGEAAEPLVFRAMALRRLQRWDEAIQAYESAQRRDPRNRAAAQGKHDAERERKIANRKDYYAILGVAKNADQKAVKRAHRKLAAKFHPDKAADGDVEEAERMFMEIGEAYEVLSDAKKRQQYDSGSDYEDIKKAEQHEQAQKHQQHHNPFGNFHRRGWR